MPKKKKSVEYPNRGMVVLCDALVMDPNSGKPNLFGVFDKFTPSDFPASTRYNVYAKLAGGSGTFDVRILTLGPDGKEVEGGAIDIPDVKVAPNSSVVVGGVFSGVSLEKAGIYRVVVRSGRKKLAESWPIVAEKKRSNNK